MSLTNKIENRVLMAATALITITATVLIMNYCTIVPMRKIYESQFKRQNELIAEMAKMAKYSITNTYTIKKVKKGAELVLSPDNTMTIQEVTKDLDAKINAVLTPADSVQDKKTFWEKLKFW